MAATTLTFSYDYGQLYLYDSELEREPDGNEYLDALDAANETGLSVGARSGVVDALMPRQENFAATMAVSVLDAPQPEPEDADHIIEFDLQLDSGRLVLEGSGGSGEAHVELPAGRYRARLAGYDFAAAASWSYNDPGNPSDTYALSLWPATECRPAEERRRWPGYDP